MEIPEGFAQINLIFAGTGVPSGAEMTYAVEVLSPSMDPTDVATAAGESWNGGQMYELQTTAVGLVQVLCKFGPTATGPSALIGFSSPGAIGSGALPPNTSMLINKNTPFGGRAGKGRFYLPGGPENNVDQAGVIAPATVTAFQANITDWFEEHVTRTIPMRVLHAPGSPLSAPSDVTSLTLQNTVATQRRRLRR